MGADSRRMAANSRDMAADSRRMRMRMRAAAKCSAVWPQAIAPRSIGLMGGGGGGGGGSPSKTMQVEVLLRAFSSSLQQQIKHRRHFYKSAVLVREGILVLHGDELGADLTQATRRAPPAAPLLLRGCRAPRPWTFDHPQHPRDVISAFTPSFILRRLRRLIVGCSTSWSGWTRNFPS